jgi:hypothetical protein
VIHADSQVSGEQGNGYWAGDQRGGFSSQRFDRTRVCLLLSTTQLFLHLSQRRAFSFKFSSKSRAHFKDEHSLPAQAMQQCILSLGVRIILSA